MIRQALPTDAPIIAQLIVAAMGELAAKFINGTDPAKALPLFEHFAAMTANQYSYDCTLVYEDETGVCGIISGYNGGDLDILRADFLKYIRTVYNNTYQPENETGPGEFYIDCLAVMPQHRGKGIGKQLISALIDKAKTLGQNTVGLLVNQGNPKAEKLYLELGFQKVGETVLLGTFNNHLQIKMA
ncbi:MAG: GNAT family N-acetyltransferase [Mucilaginibacter sp.]